MKKIILLLSIFFISSCAFVEEEKFEKIDKRLSELEKVNILEKKDNSFIDVSFKAHIVQIGGLHSALYDGSFWDITSLDFPSPISDNRIYDIHKSGIDVDYRGRKDYFNITCPDSYFIMSCDINGTKIKAYENSCRFDFAYSEKENNDIFFICNNGKLSTGL